MPRFASLFFTWMLHITIANSVYTPCTVCIDEATPDAYTKIGLILYTGPNIASNTRVGIDDPFEFCNLLDKSRPTVVFIPGWIGMPISPHVKAVINAYLSRGDHNVILLDWSVIAVAEYTYSARSVEGIGYNLAMALNKLVASCLDPTSLYIVGHSLGAQVCGFVGRNVNFTLPKIIGLDPAGPGFYITAAHLTYADAEFVEIIHADRGGLGITLQTGNVDFYPNDGRYPQPGCSLIPLLSNACGHYRSVYMFAQSVYNESAFTGYACNSYIEFQLGLCRQKPTALMGYATPTNSTGRYYLNIGGELLYGQEPGYTFIAEVIPVIESLPTNSYLHSIFNSTGLF